MKNFSIFSFFFWVVLLPLSMVAQQWQVLNVSGLPNSANSQLIFSPVDAEIVWGIQSTDAGIVNPKFVLTTDGGGSWTQANVQIPYYVRSIYAVNETIAYLTVDDPAGSNSGIYKTTDSGTSWEKHSTAFLGTGRHPVQIYFFDVNNGLCVGNPSNGYWEIYTTADGGGNWTRVPQSNIPPNAVNDRTFTTTSAAAENSYWFGTCARDLFRTTDRGLTWAVTHDAFYKSSNFCGVDIAFKDPMNGIAVTRMGDGETNRVYRTTDGGENWLNLQTPPIIPSFKFLNYVEGDIYIAASHATTGYPVDPGSAYTPDGGDTWHVIDNLIHGPAWSGGGWSWSGGVNDIVYKISNDSLVTDVEDNQNNLLPNGFTLEQNYPNPFNPSTSIRFSIPTSEFVTLKVYDVLGNEVAILVNEEKPAGNYEIEFTSHSGLSGIRELPSGIYFYTLKASSFTQTKKLILMK